MKSLINEKQAAEFLCISPRTLQQYRFRGYGPKFIRISPRCIRYSQEELLKWVEDQKRSSTFDEKGKTKKSKKV